MADHNHFANLIWQIADLLRGPYRPPQYERVMLPMTVLRRFDCVPASSKHSCMGWNQRARADKTRLRRYEDAAVHPSDINGADYVIS